MIVLLRWTLKQRLYLSIFNVPSGMMHPVLKLCSCYSKVCSSPLQRSPFWVFLRIVLVLIYATDSNCHSRVTSTGECELTLHAVVLRWWESGDVEGTCVTAGLEANMLCWAKLPREIQPAEPLPCLFPHTFTWNLYVLWMMAFAVTCTHKALWEVCCNWVQLSLSVLTHIFF